MTTTPREKLRALTGRVPSRCFWIDIPSPMVAEAAGRVGPELCVIDTEHGQIGPETAADMIRALDLSRTPALVRLGDAGAGRVKHALDAGAAGVIIPFVEFRRGSRRGGPQLPHSAQGHPRPRAGRQPRRAVRAGYRLRPRVE